MTEHPTNHTTPNPADEEDEAAAARRARQARVADLASARGTKRRHPAQGARVAAAGIGTATMLGLVGLMGYAAHPTSASASAPAPAPVAQPQIVVVVHRTGTPDTIATNVAPSAGAATTVTARPTVRPASPKAQAPAASTSGSK